jgi:ligand-binding sensor domain-containing protein
MMNKMIQGRKIIFVLLAFLLAACAPAEAPSTADEGELSTGWTSYTGAKYVVDMAFDNDGNLWVVGAQGVARIDPISNTHTNYTMEDGLGASNVTSVAVAGDGALWFGTGNGVSRYAQPE